LYCHVLQKPKLRPKDRVSIRTEPLNCRSSEYPRPCDFVACSKAATRNSDGKSGGNNSEGIGSTPTRTLSRFGTEFQSCRQMSGNQTNRRREVESCMASSGSRLCGYFKGLPVDCWGRGHSPAGSRQHCLTSFVISWSALGAVAVYLGRAGLLASCRLLVSHGQIAAVKVLLHTLPVKGTAILAELHRASCLDFVLIELDLAATFCELALSTQDEERKERNTRNARKAYDSALHFFQRLSSAPADQAHVYEKASRLNGFFERLGLNASQSGFRRISFQIIP